MMSQSPPTASALAAIVSRASASAPVIAAPPVSNALIEQVVSELRNSEAGCSSATAAGPSSVDAADNYAAINRAFHAAGNALGAPSSLCAEDAERIFTAATRLFSHALAALEMTPSNSKRNTTLNAVSASFCSFLTRAARVSPHVRVAAACDGLLARLLSAGVVPSVTTINALLNVTVALHAPAATARLVRALSLLDRSSRKSIEARMKPYETITNVIIRAKSSNSSLTTSFASTQSFTSLFFASARDQAEASRPDAHLLATARVFGVETASAAEPRSTVALEAILDVICDQRDDAPCNFDALELAAATTGSSPAGTCEAMALRLRCALKLLTECSEFDAGGVLAQRTLSSALQLAALRSWYAKSPEYLMRALGEATRENVARVFAELSFKQALRSKEALRNKLGRKHAASVQLAIANRVSTWRIGAVDAIDAMNDVASYFVKLIAASSVGRISGARADRVASILRTLYRFGVPPNADVATRFLRIALADATPELSQGLLQAIRGGPARTRREEGVSVDAGQPLSATASARALAWLDDALCAEAHAAGLTSGTSLQIGITTPVSLLRAKPPAHVLRAAALALEYFSRVGAVPSSDFLERLAEDSSTTWLAAASASSLSCGCSSAAPRTRAVNRLAPASSPLFRSQRVALEALVADASRAPANDSFVSAQSTAQAGRPARSARVQLKGDCASALTCESPPRDAAAASNAPSRFLDALATAGITSVLPTRALVQMTRAALTVGCSREAWATWRVLRTRLDDADVDAPLALALLRLFCAGGVSMAAPAWDVYVTRVRRAPGPLPSFAALSAWVLNAQLPSRQNVLLDDVAEKLKGAGIFRAAT
jgi:hypothetical protein